MDIVQQLGLTKDYLLSSSHSNTYLYNILHSHPLLSTSPYSHNKSTVKSAAKDRGLSSETVSADADKRYPQCLHNIVCIVL